MQILAYILAHWVEWLFTACITILAIAYRGISAKFKKEQKQNEAIAEGVKSLLRESIVTSYNRYSNKGYCPIYAKESLKSVYSAYHDLGGNDVATGLYKELLDMPTEKKEEKNED